MRRMTMTDAPIRVAAVILFQDGRVLLQHRDDNPAIRWPGAFAFFGGHMEPGETPEEAARREITEELGLTLGPLESVYHATAGGIERFIFKAALAVPEGDLVQSEGQGRALIGRDELDRYPIVPLHREILERCFDWGVR